MEREQHPYDTIIDGFGRMRIPRDLTACILWVAGAVLTLYLPFLNVTILRILFAIPLLLFIPGYALVATLFPAARDIGGLERFSLSVALSVALVPLTGLVLTYTPLGLHLDPVVISLGILTIGLCLAAQYRRAKLLPENRFVVPLHEMRQVLSEEFNRIRGTSSIDRILAAILVVAIIASVISLVYVIIVPKEGEMFTEFYILDQDQMAADYPTHLITGINNSVFIGITNHEDRTVNYTVETYLMKMTVNESTNASVISAMDPVDRFTVQAINNQTVISPGSYTAGSTDYNRVEFLLFNDTVPDDRVTGLDRINRSYRNLHLWVSVKPRV
jgi:uncharacterized membrane protein